MIAAQDEVTGHKSGADEHFRPAQVRQALLDCLRPLSRAQKSVFRRSMLFGPSPGGDRFARIVMGPYRLDDAMNGQVHEGEG